MSKIKVRDEGLYVTYMEIIEGILWILERSEEKIFVYSFRVENLYRLKI